MCTFSNEIVHYYLPPVSMCYGVQCVGCKPHGAEAEFVVSLTMMYAFLFMNLMKCSRHQKQHLRQQSRKRAKAFWAPGGGGGQSRALASETDTMRVVRGTEVCCPLSVLYLWVCDPGIPGWCGRTGRWRGWGRQTPGSLCDTCRGEGFTNQTYDLRVVYKSNIWPLCCLQIKHMTREPVWYLQVRGFHLRVVSLTWNLPPQWKTGNHTADTVLYFITLKYHIYDTYKTCQFVWTKKVRGNWRCICGYTIENPTQLLFLVFPLAQMPTL